MFEKPFPDIEWGHFAEFDYVDGKYDYIVTRSIPR